MFSLLLIPRIRVVENVDIIKAYKEKLEGEDKLLKKRRES